MEVAYEDIVWDRVKSLVKVEDNNLNIFVGKYSVWDLSFINFNDEFINLLMKNITMET